ncbi:MAG: 2,5-diamino-6-(ribosylamino)-4(3H)-pyrimidinone 5'-phosphate reductase [Thermoplasmata archaeon]|nr:2,5-diamino-6-(ribosylamino)-4(3H)-pyrimidinone 5'-phosphate reductase [Thermoplasmata archaeon]
MKRPYVIINCASSADGKIATVARRQTRISSPEDLRRVHRLRRSVDAVLVGVGTILADDPHLTVKKEYVGNVKGAKNPVRVVVDSKGRTPSNARVLDDRAETIVAVAQKPGRRMGRAEVIVCGMKGKVDLNKLMGELHKRRIRKLLVEGGSEIIWSFLKEKLADELKIFIGNVVMGGRTAPTVADGEGVRKIAEATNLDLKRVRRLEGGVLLEYSVLK